MVINMSSHSKGNIVAGVPPTVSAKLSHVENQDDNGSHECMSLGGKNPCQFQGIDPRGGAEFDKNGPNLTEDVNFTIRTTLVGSNVLKKYRFRNRIKSRREVGNNILMA